MGKVVDFPNKDNQPVESNGPKMTPEELKLLIEQNTMLQYALKVMNDIPLMDDTPVDYMELWNKVSLQKKVDAGETNEKTIAFYYTLLSAGYDNFGTLFFHHFANSDNAPLLYYAIKCFIVQLDENAEYIEKLENKIKELENKIKELENK